MAWGTVNVQSAGSKGAPNGAEWTQSNLTNITVNKIHHINGLWVLSTAGKGLYYSEDGKTWTQSNVTSGDFWDVICDDYFWFAGSSDSGLWRSKDGKTWDALKYATDNKKFVTSHQRFWVAGGGNSDNQPKVIRLNKSIDAGTGTGWTSAMNSSGYSGPLQGLYSVDPYYLLAMMPDGNATVYGFSYVDTWPSNSSSLSTLSNSGHTLYGLIVYNGLIFMCWDNKVTAYNTSITSRGSLTISTAKSISYGNGVVMITGPEMKPKYCKPVDALATQTWVDCSVAPLGIEKAAYGNGVWVGTGTAGTFIAGKNLEWSQTSTISSNCALYADGAWVLAGNDGVLYYSEAFTSKE